MRHTLKPVIGLVAAAVVAMPLSAWAGEVLDRVMSNNMLVVASDANYPPQSFLDENNELQGFDVDVAREVAKRLGVEIVFVTPDWEVIVAGKWGGRWDLSIGSMTPTKQRAKVLDFPAVYYYTPASFVVHQDNTTIKKVADLNGKTIGVCGGCTYEWYLLKNLVIDAEGAPPFEYQVTAGEIRSYADDATHFEDLKLGDGVRLDAVFTALPNIQAAIERGYPMKVVGEPAFFEPLSLAIDKGDPELSAKLTAIIEAMHADDTLTKFSMNWYGADLTKAAPEM
ncbi:MAG: transporter substrate-binding domain-containing protein [Alphaproteobacteria bacterium]